MNVHKWHFFRAGGVDQVSLRDARDLEALDQLDPKLWVALAMPTRAVDLDPMTLDMIDTDHDGRIRIAEVLAANTWARATFKDPADLLASATEVKLASLADAKVIAAAKRMLGDLGKPDATAISVDDATASAKALNATKLNGDGIVTPESAEAPALAHAITDAIAAVGSVADRSGKPGIDQPKADEFFAEIDKRHAHVVAGAQVTPHGDRTGAMADAFAAVRDKLDDFFTRCRMAAYDPRAAAALSGQDAELVALGAQSLSAATPDVAKLPLARIDASGKLSLGAGLNPAWSAKMSAFAAACAAVVLGPRDAITADDVAKISDSLAPYETWRAATPITKVDALELAWVGQLAAPDLREQLRTLILADAALAAEYESAAQVTRAVYFQRDFGRLLRNFVSFSDFYSHQDGMFQVGTLYLDAREIRLCISVEDPGKHAILAASSDAYLVYCDIQRGSEKKQIVAALSNGDEDNVFVGRNGVFYDRAGKDWDATVSKVVGNPISVRQAFWSPYKKAVRAIEDMVNKRAQAAQAETEATVATTATEVANAEATAKTAPAAPAPAAPPPPVETTMGKKIDLGTVAALGVAVGGIGTLVGAILSAIFGLGPWLPFGVIAFLLLISGPSMLIAWLKLRRRNLGPILDANGWAINGRARINVAFGAAMTELAKLPPGSQSSVDDPFSDKKTPWRRWVVLGVIVLILGLWFFGRIDRYLPVQARSTSLLGEHAWAWQPTPPVAAGSAAPGAAGSAAPAAAGSAAAPKK